MTQATRHTASRDREPRPRHPLLSDRGIRALQPARTAHDIRDGGTPGLILRVLPSGQKQFSVRYRIQGKQRRLLLGEYPAVSLAEARKRARRVQSAVDDGRDPAGERQALKVRPSDTVAALGQEYVAKHARKFKRSADEDERILEVYILPQWRDRSVRGLTRREVRALVERVAERAPVMANRVLALVRKMLNFAVSRDWIDANPAARMERPGAEHSRDRVLSDDELRALWGVLSRFPARHEKQAPGRPRATRTSDDQPLCPISPALAAVQQVRLLTAQRGGEVVGMRWGDVDLAQGWWTIPADRSKNGQPHRVPLTAEVVALIRSQHGDAGEASAPDACVFAGLAGASVESRAPKASAALSRVLGFAFRGHDLRRTAATRMAAAGVPREHIGHVLNHVQGSRVTRIYDRYLYDREKRMALETWARTLTGILENRTAAASIVPFAASGRPSA
jgi:integrase